MTSSVSKQTSMQQRGAGTGVGVGDGGNNDVSSRQHYMPRGSLHAVTSTHNGLSSRSALPRNSVRATIKKGERLTPSSTAARGGAGDDRVVGGRATGEREHAHVLGTGLRYRRTTLDTNNRQSDHTTCDRQASPTEVRDPLRQSRDKSVSEVPGIHAERGGQGRDGPAIIREPTGGGGGGVGHGGGDKERCLSRAGAGGERERGGALKVGGAGAGTAEEELPMEVPGRYERMRVLGRGSFGAVTLVKDHRDSKLYAMKTLNCSDKLDERQTAMEEVRLLRWLKHPCILTLFDTFLSADGRLVCLTTTYCESGDLAKIVKHAAKTKSFLGEKTVLGWFAQLCLGVQHLHEEKKVLHRDIKPNNIFLMDSKKIVQLGDFGLAKVIKDDDKRVKAEVGTPYYTSPEMCNNQPYGFPSDVWSLGIVLFELLALHVPFRSRDVVELVSQVIRAPPPPLPEVYSHEVTGLARWMLQKDPQRRPTLTQVLSCQPLRRHMNSFVKNYRPMNMAERQRRHDIKDLECQVASILERGGDDPQIPADINDGCGTLQHGAAGIGQDDSSTPHGAGVDAKSQPLEPRGGGEAGRTIAAGTDGVTGSACGIAIARAATADSCTTGRNLSNDIATAGWIPAVGNVSLSTDADGKGDGGGGACTRCGARVSCACGVSSGAGGGSAPPGGRRFGSPQPSTGARSVMSWGTLVVDEEYVDGDDERHRDSDGHRPKLSSDVGIEERGRSSGGGEDDGSSGIERRGNSSCGRSKESDQWRRREPLNGGGSSSDSLHSHDASSAARASGSRTEACATGDLCNDVGGSGKKRSLVRGHSDRKSGEDGSDAGYDVQGKGYDPVDACLSTEETLEAARRPAFPRSPRSQVSTRTLRTSGCISGAGGDAGAGAGNGRQDDVRLPDDVVDTGGQDRRIHQKKDEGSVRDRERQSVVAGGTIPYRETLYLDDPGEGQGGCTAAGRGNAGERVSESGESSASSVHPSQALSADRQKTSSAGEVDANAAARLATATATTAAGRRRSSRTAIPVQHSLLATAATVVGEAAPAVAGRATIALDPVGTGPRIQRPPRLSEISFKTAKRLSEALAFAAAGDGTVTVAGAKGTTSSVASTVRSTHYSPRQLEGALRESSRVPAAIAARAAGPALPPDHAQLYLEDVGKGYRRIRGTVEGQRTIAAASV